MKIKVYQPSREGSPSSLSLEYRVPVQENVYCMGVYDDIEKHESLHHYLELTTDGSYLPSILTFESGDTILLLNGRKLVVQQEFTLSVPLGLHEAIILEAVSYYIAGSYLCHRNKDPNFFRIFEQRFRLYPSLPFTEKEIAKNVLASDCRGATIEEYFQIDKQLRKTFVSQ